jgi:hypothetical protein
MVTQGAYQLLSRELRRGGLSFSEIDSISTLGRHDERDGPNAQSRGKSGLT